MAGIVDEAIAPGMWRQVRLIGWLRWRLFVNSTRQKRAKLELAANIALGIIASLVALAIGFGLAAAAYVMTSRGRLEFVSTVYWGLFLFGQFFPFLVSLSTAQLDEQHLLRFPLRFPVFYGLNLFYGMIDPVAVTGAFWLTCTGVGIVYARPGMLPWAVLLLGMFATFNLLLNTYATALLSKLMQKRRAKEIVFVIFITGMIGFQFLANWAVDGRKYIQPYWEEVRPVLEVFPPSATGMGIARAARGDIVGIAYPIALLGGYVLILGALLSRRLQRVYEGEDTGWSPAATVTAEEKKVTLSWKLPGLSGPIAAMIEKEIRYLTRNAPMFLQLIIPLFVVGLMSQAMGRPPRPGRTAPNIPVEWMFPGALGYALLVLAPMIHNCFSYDGKGVQSLLMAPVRFREILIGKNIMQGLMVLLNVATIWGLLGILKKLPGPTMALATLAAMIFAALAHMSVGNMMSLKYPKRFDFGKFKQRQSGMSVLIAMLLQVLVMGLIAIGFATARFFGAIEYAAAGFLVLAAAMFQVYLLSLERCDTLAEEKRELLAAELCKEV
ncbi:MAG: hypothetical protein HY046_08880 [Acidobacteria bacterium]|nr:hypothetical protein [Acidobacteriota bacterium]